MINRYQARPARRRPAVLVVAEVAAEAAALGLLLFGFPWCLAVLGGAAWR